MKRIIIAALLVGLYVVNLSSQQQELFQLPGDSIPRRLPPFRLEGTDTLRFNPGDTIPLPLWNQHLAQQKTDELLVIQSPFDGMPIVVPPGNTFHLIVTRPDATYHYHSRNLGEEEQNPLRARRHPGIYQIPQKNPQ